MYPVAPICSMRSLSFISINPFYFSFNSQDAQGMIVSKPKSFPQTRLTTPAHDPDPNPDLPGEPTPVQKIRSKIMIRSRRRAWLRAV